MRSDFSNLTFHPRHGYSRVLFQQGQLVTDAQSNEQTAILLHFIRTLTADLLGPHGGPAGNTGFKLYVVKDSTDLKAQLGATPDPALDEQFHEFGGSLLLLLPGRYYLDGLPVDALRVTSLWRQPYGSLKPFDQTGRKLLVLDAWEQQLSPVDLPGLNDVAFAPARGADRAAVVWRVLAIDGTDVPTTASTDEGWWQPHLDKLAGLPGERGLLSAGTLAAPKNDSPCLLDPEDGYRGETGQLIRVEVQTPGPDKTASIKWSFDNGSVRAACTGVVDDSTLRYDPSGLVGSFATPAWVELSGLQDDLDGTPGQLLEVAGLNDDELHLTGLPAGTTLQSLYDKLTAGGRTASLRLWDQQPEPGAPEDWPGGARRIEENTDIHLGQGVQIRFHRSPDAPPGKYRSGDYWLIAARPGQVQALPGESGTIHLDGSVPPYGPDHRYAPLALVDVDAQSVLTVKADFRRQFAVLPFLNF